MPPRCSAQRSSDCEHTAAFLAASLAMKHTGDCTTIAQPLESQHFFHCFCETLFQVSSKCNLPRNKPNKVILIHENVQKVTGTGTHCCSYSGNKTYLLKIMRFGSFSSSAHWGEIIQLLQGTISEQFGHRNLFFCFKWKRCMKCIALIKTTDTSSSSARLQIENAGKRQCWQGS